MSLQYQLEIYGPIKSVASISKSLIINLLNACNEDDIQALVVPPLEEFGRWLMVDSARVEQGTQALSKPQMFDLPGLKLRAGVADQGITKILRENVYLTSAFLFVIGCTSCLSCDKTGKLMHEIMRLNGMLNAYPIPPQQMCQFVVLTNGCKDFLVGETPAQVYDRITTLMWEQNSKQGLRLDDLCNDSDEKKLAQLFLQVYTALADADIKHVWLKGSRTGTWLAAMFIWLRPKEVEVFVQDNCIYPFPAQFQDGENSIKLSIRIVRRFEATHATWEVTTWTDHTGKDLASELIVLQETLSLTRNIASPLRSTKQYLGIQGYSSNTLDVVGHLSAALVIRAVETGRLILREGMSSSNLLDICSPWFLGIYPSVMAYFGWHWGGSDNNRVNEMVGILERNLRPPALRKGQIEIQDLSITDTIAPAIAQCFQGHGNPLLATILGGESFKDCLEAVEIAVYLAAEALRLCFCESEPRNAIYTPLEQDNFRKSAITIANLLYPEQYADYSRLRSRVPGIVFPNSSGMGATDLAVAGDGYVAVSAVIFASESDLTDQRTASLIKLIPGHLKREGLAGRFNKLMQEPEPVKTGVGVVAPASDPVELFGANGDFVGLDDDQAQIKLKIGVEHLTRSDEIKNVIYLSTYLNVFMRDKKVRRTVQTDWRQSIEAIASAHHIMEYTSRPRQQEAIAREWLRKGRLGDCVQWRQVGQTMPQGGNYIMATRANAQLRFFEAGNTPPGSNLLIRHGSVPLIHCIQQVDQLSSNGEQREARYSELLGEERAGNEANWVIIA